MADAGPDSELEGLKQSSTALRVPSWPAGTPVLRSCDQGNDSGTTGWLKHQACAPKTLCVQVLGAKSALVQHRSAGSRGWELSA